MTELTKKEMKEGLFRDFEVRKDSVDEEARTVELAFSSEEEYERWFGIEVLDHDSKSVRLGRLNGGAAVLVNHDTRDQVGVVETATIDSDRMGRATVRFSKSQRGEEIFQDVKDGIRKLVSVGYRIHGYEVTERKGQADLVRITDWEPFELSIVPVPADTTVGVGRNTDDPEKVVVVNNIDINEETKMTEAEKAAAAAAKKAEPAAPEFDETAERERVRTSETQRIDAIKAMADKYPGLEDIRSQAISEGWDVAKFSEKSLEIVGEQNNKARGEQKEEADVDLDHKEREKFSFMRLMGALANPNDRAAQTRAAFELEVCAEGEKQMPGDFNARGSYIPPSLYGASSRDLSVGTATDGAELVGTSLLAANYIEVLRNNMTLMQSGLQMLPGLVGNINIPRQTSGAVMGWLSGEAQDASESDPQFDQVSLTPKDAAVYTEVTRRLMQQSTPAVEGLIRNDLFMAIALGTDSAGFYGTGSSGQPQGIDGATGVDDPTFSSATAPTYAEMRTQMKTLMTSNAANNLRYIISADTWEQLGITPKQASGVEGNFVLNETMNSILGRNYVVSTQLAADDFVLGDFSQMIMGEWGGLELNVDPYTKALSGNVRFIVFKTMDLAIRHPEAFSFHNAA